MVKIGIIGGGFGGLGLAYYLRKSGDITLIEAHSQLGGMSSSFKDSEWEWPVDKVIHHWFTSDKRTFKIASDLGIADKLITKNTKSSCFYKGCIAQLDSPSSLLKFPFLSMFDRLRTAFGMAVLKSSKDYLGFEKETAYKYIKDMMGESSFNIIWKPLFVGKFGKHAQNINAAWFWSRIHARTKKLVYMQRGFQYFMDKLAEHLKEKNVKILLKSPVTKITKKGKQFIVKTNNKTLTFDKLILATQLQDALNLYPFPKKYKEKYSKLKSIGAQYFTLELNRPFLRDKTYWLNINESDFPFMMVAEHTNFIDKSHYNNKHIIWVGKYLDYDNPLWKLTEKQLLKKIIPYLKKINPTFTESDIKHSFFVRFKNAQPILPVSYSKMIPPFKTPEENLFLLNMNQIYPWDRGTNNALGLAFKLARQIKKEI